MYNFYKQKLCTPSGYMSKFLLIMRLTTLLLIISMLQVSASSLAQRVTLIERNTPLVQVFNKISEQCGYDFLVTSELLKKAKLVNINTHNQELKDVLEKIFDDQPLSFSVKGRIVVITKKEKSLLDRIGDYISSIDISGRVVDEQGRPLAGVNVRTEDNRVLYVTGIDGRFRFLHLSENERLITSYVGYKTDTSEVRNRQNITIKLFPQVNTIEDVQVFSTGYQRLEKQRATGSFSKPDMELFQNRASSNDVVARLDGLVAGLTVIPGPGGIKANRYGTGSNQQSIIRGKSSLQLQSDPLYVIDGVQSPNLSNINPNDIADITVLKDAAAAAIYGAKAANGVIVITTKTGKKNERVRISYNGNFAYSGKPKFKPGFYLNSKQYIQAAKEVFDPVSYPYAQTDFSGVAPHERILYDQYEGRISAAQATKSLDSLSNLDNSKQIMDLFYRESFSTLHSLSASAGGESYSIYSSLSYLKDQSQVPGANNNTYRISINQTLNPAKWLSFGLNTSLNNNISSAQQTVDVGRAFLPYQLFMDDSGNALKMNYTQGYSDARRADYQLRSRINLDYIPLDEFSRAYSNVNLLNVSNTANVGIKFWKGLSFQGTYGYQKTNSKNENYQDQSNYNMRKELLNFTVAPTASSVPVYYLPSTGGRFATNQSESRNWTVRNQLVFTSALRGAKDKINIQVGQEAQESLNSIQTNIVRGYDDVLKTYSLLNYQRLSQPLFGAVGSGYSIFSEKPYTIVEEKSRFTSYFALFNYSLDNKHMLDASVRKDKSSLFASEVSAQNKPVYSIGTKWILSREKFMQNLSWMDNLALRLTYGVTGNSPYIGAGSIYDILAVSENPTLGNSLAVNTPANNNLSWEHTGTINVGIDLAVLRNRLTASIDAYSKKTTDLIGRVNFNPLLGFESTIGNIGELRNKGIEVTLNSQNIVSPSFSWSTGLIFSYNYNKLVSYSDPSQFETSADSRLNSTYQVGYGTPSIFAYQYAGLDNLGDPQIRLADGTITKDPMAAKPEDLVYMGSALPKFNGGLTNRFAYKAFTLSANIVYNLGGVMRRPVNGFYGGRLASNGLGGGNLLSEFENRWRKPGDEAFTDIPGYVADQGANFFRRKIDYYVYSDRNVISASYLKLRDITLAYSFPKSFMEKLRIQNANVFLQSGNYMLWKANKYDLDPEYMGYDRGGRTYSIGLNVTF